MEIYDLIIIGQGPAGYSASIYASRMGLNTIVVGEDIGGLIAKTHIVENYPGFISLSGAELAEKFREHAMVNGKIKSGRITNIYKDEEKNLFVSTPKRGDVIYSKGVIIATGAKPKKLNAKGEETYFNHGVSYCATCDGSFFKGKDVCVIGGGDGAAKEAILLAGMCNKVYIIYRGENIRPEPINRARIDEMSNIEILTKTEIDEFLGDSSLKQVRLNNGNLLDVEGAFVSIGHEPQTSLGKDLGLEMDDHNQIIVDFKTQATSMKNVYAAGECTNDIERQVITSSAGGVRAVLSYFKNKDK